MSSTVVISADPESRQGPCAASHCPVSSVSISLKELLDLFIFHDTDAFEESRPATLQTVLKCVCLIVSSWLDARETFWQYYHIGDAVSFGMCHIRSPMMSVVPLLIMVRSLVQPVEFISCRHNPLPRKPDKDWKYNFYFPMSHLNAKKH